MDSSGQAGESYHIDVMTPAAPHWAQPARALRPAARPDLGSQHCHTSRSFVIASALRVEITCGAAIETEHPILCAVADGRIIVSIGDIDRVNLARSAVKPLQAFPLVASAAADDAELTIACASHSGESGDVRIVTHWLTRLGLSREPPVRAGPARRLPHARPPPRRRPLPLLRRGGTGAAGRAAAVGRQLRLPPGQLGHRGRRLRRPGRPRLASHPRARPRHAPAGHRTENARPPRPSGTTPGASPVRYASARARRKP